MILIAKLGAVFVMLIMACYTVRHLVFTIQRLFCRQRLSYIDLAGIHMPSISVLIPMHNEEAVARDVMEAILKADYPHANGSLEIIPIDDHSTDRTAEILDEYAKTVPIVRPLHRRGGVRGKPAALKDATEMAKGEILVLFDADYIPGRSLLKFLVAPFADPQVGAVMGRVVPHNVGASLLSRLLDLERAGGYQVNQQARYNLGLIAQFGGTVGSVRRAALDAVGGWDTSTLAEDTALTLQLAIAGWKVAYVNRAECYEEVPVTWEVRRRQIERWAIGHTQCLAKYLFPLIRSRYVRRQAKIDGVLMLCVYLTAPLIIAGWAACLALFFAGDAVLPGLTAFFLAGACYSTFGNAATFFEIAASVVLDGGDRRLRLLPLSVANFLFSTVTVSCALARYGWNNLCGRNPSDWHKTARFRRHEDSAPAAGAVRGGAQSVNANMCGHGGKPAGRYGLDYLRSGNG